MALGQACSNFKSWLHNLFDVITERSRLQTWHILSVIYCIKIHVSVGSQGVLEVIHLSGMGRWLLSKFYYHHHYYYSGFCDTW